MKIAFLFFFSMVAFWPAAFSEIFFPTPIGPNGDWEHTEDGVTYRFFAGGSGFVAVDVDPSTAGTVRIRDRVFAAEQAGGVDIYSFTPITFNSSSPSIVEQSKVIFTLNGFATPSDLLEGCNQITRLEIGQAFAGAAYAGLFEDCTALEQFYVFTHPDEFSTRDAITADNNFASSGVLYGIRRPPSSALETQLIHYPAAKGATHFTVPIWVDAIGPEAFLHEGPNPSLTSISFYAGLRTIRERAFLGHTSIRSVQFASGMSSLTIKDQAMAGLFLTNLSTIDAVTVNFERSAFSNLTGTATLSFGPSVSELNFGKTSFFNAPFLTLNLPNANIDIGPSAFSTAAIETLTFPTGASSRSITIEPNAFFRINAETVDFGDAAVSLKHLSFNFSDLKNVHLGPNTFFETFYAFRINDTTSGSSGTSSDRFYPFPDTLLEAFTVSPSNPYFRTIDGALYSRDGTELIIYPKRDPRTSLEIPEGVETIKSYALFDADDLATITFPASLVRIEKSAIESSRLQEVTFLGAAPLLETEQRFLDLRNRPTGGGQTVVSPFETSVGVSNPDPIANIVNLSLLGGFGQPGDSFGNFEITIFLEFTLDSDDRYIISGIDNSFDGTIFLPGSFLGKTVKAIGANAFQFSSIRSVSIPQNITEIGNFAFNGSNLESILSFGGVTDIGQGAFAGTNLSEVVLPDGLTAIASNTFQGSTSLSLVVIPSTVSSLGNFAFEGCESLETLIANGPAFSLGFDALFTGAAVRNLRVRPDNLAGFGGLGNNFGGYTVGVQGLLFSEQASPLGAAYEAPEGDPINRGFSNAIAYLIGLDLNAQPTTAQRAQLPTVVEDTSDLCVEFIIPKQLPQDLAVSLQVIDDLAGGEWTTVAEKTLGAPWQGAVAQLEIIDHGPDTVKACYALESNFSDTQFARLVVELEP